MRVVRPIVHALSLALLALQPIASAGPAPSPGAVQDTLRRPPPPAPSSEPVVEQAPTPAPERPATPGERSVVVQAFQFTGNQVVPTADLEAEVAAAVGKSLTIADLFDLADRLTAFYQARGYGLAQVILPAQRVDSGVIRFEVIEGRIGRVMVDGNRTYDESFIKRSLRGMESGKVLVNADLERELLLLNDRPGLAARAVIQPGAEYGTSDIVIRLDETPYTFGASLDNFGREVLGEKRFVLNGAINSLTGRGDTLSGSLVYAEHGFLKYLAVGYALPVDQRGSTLAFSANKADYEVGGPVFAALGLTGDNANYRVDWTRPLTRTRWANSVLTLGVVRSTADSFVASVNQTNSTTLNYLEASMFWNRARPSGGGWTALVTYSGNLQGQDPAPADPDGIDSSAMKARLKFDGSWSAPFGRNWLFVTRGTVQWTPEALPDIQKFSLGGPYVLRGYDSSESRGDSGWALMFEAQKHLRAGKTPYALSVFVDAGQTRSEDLVIAATPVPGTSTSMQAAGLGLLWNPGGRFTAQVQWATPVGSYTSPVDDGSRLWATVGVNF